MTRHPGSDVDSVSAQVGVHSISVKAQAVVIVEGSHEIGRLVTPSKRDKKRDDHSLLGLA